MKKSVLYIVAAVLALSFLSGCNTRVPAATATPAPTSTVKPTSTPDGTPSNTQTPGVDEDNSTAPPEGAVG